MAENTSKQSNMAKAQAAAAKKRAEAKAKVEEQPVVREPKVAAEPTEEDIVKAHIQAKAEEIKPVEVAPVEVKPVTVSVHKPLSEIVELAGGKCELRVFTPNGYRVLVKASREKCEYLQAQL